MNVYKFDEERARREQAAKDRGPRPPSAPPVFNLPDVIIWLGGAMIAIHVLRAYALPQSWDNWIVYLFAFWPAKYAAFWSLTPLDMASSVWSSVSYSLLHGGAMHIIFNLLWMAIFGSAVARRFGAMRFLVFSALCSVGGAAAHLATNWGETAPMIGASAAVSGQMAAAIRFVFELGGPLGAFRRSDQAAYYVPAQPLAECFQNRQVLVFVAVWFGLNLFFGIMSGPVAGQPASVAWQAHIGGFIAGLALFPLLDPVPRRQN
ncbi:rhomboid family intramembrane serine protease [uncultured Roseibium sp.]|uniref:rhomboid family intramembrane serine protease n=1 Tax=uncultured Roseibium sp. TaxID=1936171 RepID=UPI0026338F99|nr:rhomboid family intramembrane serine protease [uncultured Roseibium sp.]